MALPPPVLSQSAPRDVQLTASGRVVAVVASLLILGGIGGGAALYARVARESAANRDLVARGTTVTGHVTRLWANGDDRHRVAYRFTVDGRTFENRVRVSDALRKTLRVGSVLNVRYLPAAPGVNDLGGTPRTTVPWPFPFVVGMLAPACGVLCLTGIARQRRLLAEGWLARGIVTSLSTHKGTHGSTHRTLKYEFTLLSGVKASGKSEASSKAPPVGAPVWVVYDPDVPTRNRTYPFSLVKPGV